MAIICILHASLLRTCGTEFEGNDLLQRGELYKRAKIGTFCSLIVHYLSKN